MALLNRGPDYVVATVRGVKKFVLFAAATVGVIVARKKIGEAKAEQALWAEATDAVKRG